MTRRTAVVAGVVLSVLAVPAVAQAHGVGGRSDLPVPVAYFVVGAGIVLLLSFGVLALRWPEPRLQGGPRYSGSGFRVPGWLGGVAATAGVLGLLLVITAGLVGDPDGRNNIAPAEVWILFWLVLPFLAAVLGNFWSSLNPWAALGKGLGWSGPEGVGVYGVLPATGAFLAFTWMELVYPDSGDPRSLAVAAVVYSGYLLFLSWRFGTIRSVSSADAFTVYHRVLSAIAPWGRDGSGMIRWRGWLRALPVLPQWRGLALFVVMMIGTVTYDGMSGTPWWESWTTRVFGDFAGSMWFGSLALVATVLVILGGYLAASAWAARIGSSPDLDGAAVARQFAHTLVPIALAYAVAHYVTLIAFEGQLLFSAISDPLGLGWNLFGTADYRANFTWLAPSVVWWIQLASILGGHVAGVVLAHDRALAVFRGDNAVRSQYAMLVLMIGLTTLGLTILAAG